MMTVQGCNEKRTSASTMFSASFHSEAPWG